MKLWRQFAEALRFRADVGGVAYRPDSDMFYQGVGYQTASGLRVSPESGMRVAAVYACVRVVAETVASLPLVIYKRLPSGGKLRALDHPLYSVLHQSPNQWQTSYEFWEMMQAHVELRGNAFARIVGGPSGAVEQIIPLHPDRVSVFRLSNGKLRYQVRYFYNAAVESYPQEQIFHLRGLSQDGLVGMSTVGVGAETIGAGMAAQEFASRFFQNDATPGGVMIHPKTLTEGAHKRIKNSWNEYFSQSNSHGVAILEEGMTYQNIGVTNKDSQLLEARQFSRGDIASLFRVPPHKIGDLSRATFSNIEQQNIEFATDCIRPRLVRLEHRINLDLVMPLEVGGGEDEYFAEFEMDALMRGDLKSRYEAYSVGINAGFLVRQEAREKENLNPIEGLDQPLMPLNLAAVGADGLPLPQQPAAPEDATGTGARAARMKMFVEEAAERVVRKEVYALRRAVGRSTEFGKFHEEVEEFYVMHAEFVRDVMHIPLAAAALYATQSMRMFMSCESQEQLEVAFRDLDVRGRQTLIELATPLDLAPRKVRKQEEFETPGVQK